MKKSLYIVLATIGLFSVLILILVFSGINSSSGSEAIIKEVDIGGNGTQIQYVTVPSEDNLKISLTNVTKIPNTTDTSEIDIYALKIEGESSQVPENYGNNVKNVQYFKNLKI